MFQDQVNHIMFQDQVNHICINLNLALYYICIEIMLQKLSCHMAIIQYSGSKSTSMCTYEQKVTSMYPPYTCILVIPAFTATANVFGEV